MKKEDLVKKYNLANNSEFLTDLDRVIVEELKDRGYHKIAEEDIKASKRFLINPVKGTVTESI